jgi:5-methylcytosine-specific restriction protein B
MIQFHPSYSYEDFIQGWRPNEDGGFRRKEGIFFGFCQKAASDPSGKYVFTIDEINRGDLSKIFGELMMLIELDKRGPAFGMSLTYSESDDDEFFVPENVYVIGLMNTADRSLAMVDYALRRRFAFIDLEPEFGSKSFRTLLRQYEVAEELINRVIDRMENLNEAIASDSQNLGRGYRIGHSFFCPKDRGVSLPLAVLTTGGAVGGELSDRERELLAR